MIQPALHEIALDWQPVRRHLPLRLGRQARARPTRVGVGLIVADVADRLRRVDRAQAVQRHLVPAVVAALPIERRVPALLLDRPPAIREPELRARIATLLHEAQILTVGDQAVGKAEGIEELAVARPLVVEGEALEAIARPLMPDPGDPLWERHPLQRRDRALR